jgi:phenylacetate-CoA ligase
MDIADSDIEANERLGEAELRALQLERLRASLVHAYANNPAYAQVR